MRVPDGCRFELEMYDGYTVVNLYTKRLQKTFYHSVDTYGGFLLKWRLKRAAKKLLKLERNFYEFKEKYC